MLHNYLALLWLKYLRSGRHNSPVQSNACFQRAQPKSGCGRMRRQCQMLQFQPASLKSAFSLFPRDINVLLSGLKADIRYDVECGVASLGGFLFDRDVLAMSLAPKDEHEDQVQFALERGSLDISAIVGTKKFHFPYIHDCGIFYSNIH
ncbi:hypothetical protein KIW84_063614 [Lathyrus oleraceus]|uniref:Methyltransferase n=1 Tax=Pisum sativum TaxID=3888 RepID=A0A9D4W9B8_PEA|nr:hypothetical protein KIW84_063614 [Pisum sativum]